MDDQQLSTDGKPPGDVARYGGIPGVSEPLPATDGRRLALPSPGGFGRDTLRRAESATDYGTRSDAAPFPPGCSTLTVR